MSKKNVALFIEALTKDKALNKKVSQADQTVAAWTSAAKGAGFEFSNEDLAVVMQKAMDKEVDVPEIIPAFLSAQSELDEAALDAVSGGAGMTSMNFSPSLVNRISSLVNLGGGMAAWGGHIKGPFSSMPGGSQTR